MFGKIVAISTVKHLSRNYASFQQPSVQEWYSLSTSGQAQNIPQRNTADFHGDGYFLQNTGHEAEEISFVVCDVNSEKEQLQVKIFVFEKIGGNFGDVKTELALCHRPKAEKKP